MTSLADFFKTIAEAKKNSSLDQDVINEGLRAEYPIHDPEVPQDYIKKDHVDTKSVDPYSNVIDQYLNYLQSSEKMDPLLQPISKDQPVTQKDLHEFNEKIRRLEVYAKNFHSGSGETRLRKLDDVIEQSIGNPDHVLRYDPSINKFYFGEVPDSPFNETDIALNSLTLNQTGTTLDPVPGMLTWNASEDCLDIHQSDDTTLQVGLETFIQVKNNSSLTLLDGTVVKFSGVGLDAIPYAEPFLADGSIPPLYMIGVLTHDIEPGETGRATTIGKVRNIDTTGVSVGEVWNVGDILWVHPSIPGALTKYQPTSPSVATSIAVVLIVDSNDGVLLVRPTIFPRLFYADFYDTTTQSITINTPASITLNSINIASGFHLDSVDSSKIVVEQPGLYKFDFSLQVSSTSGSRSNVWIWYRKNGVDVPYTTSQFTIESNDGKVIPSWSFTVSMNTDDYFQLMWTADSDRVTIASPPATSFCPAVPSVILTIAQVNL